MGFSGRPSRGCAPCRAKRTKCDLVRPFCTQCVRKNRICSGYRQEQDMRFVNETKLVIRKATRRTYDQPQLQSSYSVDRINLDVLNMQSPSRSGALSDEAVMYFFANHNKKFFLEEGQPGENGLDYVLPLYQKDSITGGPLSEIINATGLAALGNRGSPKLLIAARAKQVKVLRLLNEQLQSPKSAFNESTLLTVVMLGVFEHVMFDSTQSANIELFHVQGAATLAGLIGPAKLTSTMGQGILSRIREDMFILCFLKRDLPPQFFLDTEGEGQNGADFVLWKLFSRLCRLRFDHKMSGSVDANMAKEAQCIADELDAWEQSVPDGHPNFSNEDTIKTNWHNKDPHHYVWLWRAWTRHQISRILATDLVLLWARAQVVLTPSVSASSALDSAIKTHFALCEKLRESLDFQIEHFRTMRAKIGTFAVYDLLWPMYIISSSPTSTRETRIWSINTATYLSEEFGIRQGKISGDMIRRFLYQPEDASLHASITQT